MILKVCILSYLLICSITHFYWCYSTNYVPNQYVFLSIHILLDFYHVVRSVRSKPSQKKSLFLTHTVPHAPHKSHVTLSVSEERIFIKHKGNFLSSTRHSPVADQNTLDRLHSGRNTINRTGHGHINYTPREGRYRLLVSQTGFQSHNIATKSDSIRRTLQSIVSSPQTPTRVDYGSMQHTELRQIARWSYTVN